ncbi:MAG TPA: carbohydrate ABC transporter permease [Roseiflexaceae bacterium]|nr:carbohydrate ABC transporter permease [Roseiflexaceae bacterium]
MSTATQKLPRSEQFGRLGRSGLARRALRPTLIYAVLFFGLLFTLLPFLWMVSSAFKVSEEVMTYPPTLVPSVATLDNFGVVLTKVQFPRFFLNSFIICAFTITGHLVSGSLAAFGFARLRFPGRNALFMLLLSTLIIPFYAYMIPRFVIIRALGLYDTLIAVVLPYMFGGPFYIFLMRQYFMSLPMELDDAARIDGCSSFGIYWRILLPLARPALATVAVLEFIAAWKSFLEPLIYLSNQNNYTVALGLTLFRSGFGGQVQWGPLMAATALSAVPPLIVCFAMQKYLIGGIAGTGLKG